MAFSADGRLLVTAGRDVRLWRVSDRQRLLTFDLQQARVHELRFEPDGKTLLFTQTDHAGKQSEIKLIDLASISGALAELGFQADDLPVSDAPQ